MVSDIPADAWDSEEAKVLILVLMEYGLWQTVFKELRKKGAKS